MLLMKIFLAILVIFVPPARWEQPKADCGIVARVNNDIITADGYTEKLNDYREELARQLEGKGRTHEDINLEVERTKGLVVERMIDDILLDQRASELGLESDAEVMKATEDTDAGEPARYADRTLTEGAAIDWKAARSAYRRNILRDFVIQREVLAPISESITDEDRRVYYNAHKDEFTLPGKISLSEVFLPFEGHSETQVELDAIMLQADLRSGSDFVKAVVMHTPASRASRATGGFLGSFMARDLKTSVVTAVSSLRPGEVSEPVRFDYGYAIYRLDSVTADSLLEYADPDVQEKISRSITMSLAQPAVERYIIQLRKNARIEVCSDMR
jgi:hypothetical protein